MRPIRPRRGMRMSAGASGTTRRVRSIRYGRTSENVVSIEGVLANGERVVFGPGAVGRSGEKRGGCAGASRRLLVLPRR